jgi:aminomethyltransferase
MSSTAPLHRTPLHALHVELGAKLVPFAGYEMPVQYPAGVLQEHVHTRTHAGLFDVSHMGQVRISGPNAAAAFEALVPIDVMGLQSGQQRYALFTTDTGGILDDLMVARLDDDLLVVVNAACKEQDITLMQRGLAGKARVEPLTDRALIALQGPAASTALQRLAPTVGAMKFMEVARVTIAGADCVVSRSGYTGEDGYEISVPSIQAETLARQLLAQPEVKPIGLGARDSLRLEAGLCLYGHDIDATTTPVEGSLVWALSKARRAGGERAGGYPGAAVIERQIKEGVARKRIGLRGLDRIPGGPAPTFGAPIAMGTVETGAAKIGTKLFAEVRGKRVPMEVTKTPFVPQRYYRG